MENTKMGSTEGISCSSAAVVSPTSSILEKNSGFVTGYDYDVFLSFRGTDTRSGFTSRLYQSLVDAGVEVFRDDDELRVGEPIYENLMKGINKSQISIAILSENYGGSKWCLKELVHMAECMHAGKQMIMPIFYKVSPRDVRHQTGGFGASFDSNKCNFSEETVGKWKQTLMEVGNLKGIRVQDDSIDSDEHETNEIKKVVDKVLRELKKTLLVTGLLVGVENHVEKIMTMLNKDPKKVKIVSLYGMGGIGKTTLAKIIYNQLLSQHRYEGWSFLANVRETSQNSQKGIMHLQGQLISDILKKKGSESDGVKDGRVEQVISQKKLLVFLDDVNEADQCKALIGDGRAWFGEGSTIIITTRNKDILNAVNVDRDDYEVMGLDFDHSLKLFSKHAFRRDSPLDGFEDYSKKVVKITGGLPLALEVIGSLLHGKPKTSWGGWIKKLENVPQGKVEERLKISYDELDMQQKEIFLDVACLFVGLDRRIVHYYWEDANLFPEEGIEVLEDRSLLKIKEDNTIWMHDQLVELGKSIVRKEANLLETQNQTRVWDRKEARNIISNQNMKAEKIKGMITELDDRGFTSDISQIVPNLTFLEVDDRVQLPDSFRERLRTIRRDGKNPIILPQLRWLSWHSSNDRSVMLNMKWSSATNLVILDLSRNPVTHLWEGWNQIKVANNLKLVNLSGCESLTRTPSFSNLLCLERLIVRNCCNLAKIDKSIGELTKLTFLDLTGCSRLFKLPKQLANLEALTEIRIDETGISNLSDPIGNLRSLEILSAKKCALNVFLPCSFGKALKLKEIYIQSCESEGQIPDDIGKLSHLTAFKITGLTQIGKSPKLPESLINLHLHFKISSVEDILKNDLNEVPDLSKLVNLRELDLRLYFHEESPHLFSIGKLSNLVNLTLSTSTLVSLEDCLISSLCMLKKLQLTDCYQLEKLPKLPMSLLYLDVVRCLALQTVDVSDLKQLLELQVSRAAITEIHAALPSSLEKLCLKNCSSLQSLKLNCSSKLIQLIIYSCPMLQCPTGLPSSLQWLIIQDCPLIKTVDDAPKMLSYLCVTNEGAVNTSHQPVDDQQLKDTLSELDSLRNSFSRFGNCFLFFPELVDEIIGTSQGISLFGSTCKRLENRMWNFIR